MNRLHHFKQTFGKNLLDNVDYPKLEFILLDYNSSDGLEEYVQKNYSHYIETGILVYFRTYRPEFYSMSHSRNVVFKLATGDIVCNIDADNFTGPGFAQHINSVFKAQKSIFLATHGGQHMHNDVLGRVCVRRADFLTVGGYEEKMKHYGFDDVDFVNRLKASGLQMTDINNPLFLKAIAHSNSERLTNGVDDQGLKMLLIDYQTPYQSKLIMLFSGAVYKAATMVNAHLYNILSRPLIDLSVKYEFSILEDQWLFGKWAIQDETLSLTSNNICEKFDLRGNVFEGRRTGGRNLHRIDKPQLVEDALFFYNQISNRIIMETNIKNGKIRTNLSGFGQEVVYKNFERSTPIEIR